MSAARIYAIANQKGGVGKTTTAMNIAAALVAIGLKVLVVDLDGQGNASTGLGVMPQDRKLTSYDVLKGEAAPQEAIVEIKGVKNLFLMPASSDLSSIDIELVDDKRRAAKLRDALGAVRDEYDVIFVDCPPSLSLLTLNAFVAADAVIVPLQCEFFALEGLTQLMRTVAEVRQSANAKLAIRGIILTMYDRRNRLTVQVERDVRDTLPDLVYKRVIPRNVRLSEAPSFGLPAMLYDPSSTGAEAYQRVALEFIKREKLEPKGI